MNIDTIVAFDIENLPPQALVGVNAEEGLTQCNKDAKVEDGIRGQLPVLNPIEEEKRAQKILRGERKTTKQKGIKHNSEALWRLRAGGRTWMKVVRFDR
jgi:hypothetical protein